MMKRWDTLEGVEEEVDKEGEIPMTDIIIMA